MTIYIVKSFILLTLLYLGYLFTIKDKRFQYNRIYLISSLIFSLVVPLIPFSTDFGISNINESTLLTEKIYGLKLTPQPPSFHQESNSALKNNFRISDLLITIYFLGLILMAFRYAKNLLSLRRIIKNSELQEENGVLLALINEDISPFNFGKYIIVNKTDYIQQKIDPQIILHEQSHLTNKHTYDILLVEFLLVIYWFNPLIWLYRQTLKINHEYLADQQVLKTNNIANYADLLISTVQKNTISLLGSNFNYFLTKKRLLMMNRTKTSSFNFGFKLTGTLLIFIATFFILAFKPITYSDNAKDDRFTVVIDVGHGGGDDGAVNSQLNLKEKDVILAIANALEQEKNAKDISYVFTRQSDESVSLIDRVALTNKVNADLLISLHINESSNTDMNGVGLYFYDDNQYSTNSKLYCNLFAEKVKIGKKSKIESHDFFISKKANCPSVFIELGFISNAKDAAFLKSSKNQKKIASQIDLVIRDISNL